MTKALENNLHNNWFYLLKKVRRTTDKKLVRWMLNGKGLETVEYITDTSLDIFLNTWVLAFLKAHVRVQDLNEIQSKAIHDTVVLWRNDLTDMPLITQGKIFEYLVAGENFYNQPIGVIKHNILCDLLFKEGYLRNVRVKAKVKAERLTFLVICFVVASIHLCLVSSKLS